MAIRICGAGYRRAPCPNSPPSSRIGGLLHPGPDHDYGRQGRAPSGSTSTGRRHQHRHADRRARGQLRRPRRGPGDRCGSTGSGRPGSRGSRTCPEFARDHRVVAMDLPGFGYSEMPDARHLDRVLRRAGSSELLDALGIEAAAVVGNSMGGFVGAEMAIRSPERVQRLVVVSAAIFWQDYRRAQPLRAARAAVRRDRRAGADARTDDVATRRRLRAWALASGGLPLPAPDLARARPRDGPQRAPHRRLPARAGGAGRLPARRGAAADRVPRR